jgi:hypothetical protein
MKWFQHLSTAHRNLKFQPLLEKFGFKGYGYWWVVCELIAEQSDADHCISNQRFWKTALKKELKITQKTLTELLEILADSDLIDRKALSDGALCIPKMKEYSSNYQRQLRRNFEVTSKKLQRNFVANRIHKNTRDNNIKERKIYKKKEREGEKGKDFIDKKTLKPFRDFLKDKFSF